MNIELKQLATVHAERLKVGVGSQATLIRMVSEQGEINQIAYITDALKTEAQTKIAQLNLHAEDKQLKLTILAQLMEEFSIEESRNA